jgi:hypothetical protein
MLWLATQGNVGAVNISTRSMILISIVLSFLIFMAIYKWVPVFHVGISQDVECRCIVISDMFFRRQVFPVDITSVKELIPLNFRPTLIRYNSTKRVSIYAIFVPPMRPLIPPWRMHPDVEALQNWIDQNKVT